MKMQEPRLQARAICRIVHRRPVEYDSARGLWLYDTLGDEEVGNLVTNLGRVRIHTYIYGTSAQRSAANLGANGFSFIGLTNDGAAPAAGDTSLAGELSGNGLTRAAGTVTLPTGAGTTTLVSHDFTYTGGSPQDVHKTALFDATSNGNMAHEILFTQRTLNLNDTITITFSITIT